MYLVTVDGKSHGEVFKLYGRWRWFKEGRGVELYHRKAILLTVRADIARLNRVNVGQVRLTKQERVAA